jgi:hypothetical protein
VHISTIHQVKPGELYFIGSAPWNGVEQFWRKAYITGIRHSAGTAILTNAIHRTMEIQAPALILTKAGEGEHCRAVAYTESAKPECYFSVLCDENVYYAHHAVLWKLDDFARFGVLPCDSNRVI